MLTPAEELGLGGKNLASCVRSAFHQLGAAQLSELTQQIREEALQRRVVYLREGLVEPIRLLPCPLAALPDQIAYLHYVSLTLQNALKRLPELYMQDFAIRAILRLPPEEEQWLWQCWGASHQETNPIFGRLDAVIDFSSPMWKESLRYVEPNMSGIGGLHLVPTCERILGDLVLPVLQQIDPRVRLEVGHDIRDLLMQEVLDHLEVVGHHVENLCFIEPKYAASGIDEQESVARYFHDRHGLRVLHADPAELDLHDGQVYYDGQRIDVAYRDYTVADLLQLERQGVTVEPMRALFRHNLMISSIAAELDQKSCWEVLTTPSIQRKYFTPEERQIFRRHILWTRLVTDRRTTLPDGLDAPLLEFIAEERERLVLKPNRAYGGEGVLLGLSTTASAWEAKLEEILRSGERWVVQQLASIPVHEFPVIDEAGSMHLEPFYTVMGFAPSKYGVAVLGRASQKQVVNVAQRGGMCVVAVGHPPARLIGPT